MTLQRLGPIEAHSGALTSTYLKNAFHRAGDLQKGRPFWFCAQPFNIANHAICPHHKGVSSGNFAWRATVARRRYWNLG